MGQASQTWGHDGHALLSLDAAWAVIAENVQPLGSEVVPLSAADGRVLAQPILAEDDCPPFHKSMMDGYAVRAADCSEAGVALRVLGLVAAGEKHPQSIGAGESLQINTGAPLPAGADAVVRLEETTGAPNPTSILVRAAVVVGQNVSPHGGIRRKGDEILSPPVRLTAARLAAAATAGVGELRVSKSVGAAILATGDELVPPGHPRKHGQIHESNALMLTSLMRQFGAMPHDMGIARDTMADLQPRLEQAMRSPVLLTAGGMSMGTHDLVPKTFELLGVRWLFHGVDLRPGKPVAYGRGPAGQHVIGLPGNPGSAFVCAWLFVRMIVRGLQGFPVQPPNRIHAALAAPIKASRDPRPAFIPARTWSELSRGLLAEPLAWGGSGDPFGLAAANAILCLSHPERARAAGEPAEIILVDTE